MAVVPLGEALVLDGRTWRDRFCRMRTGVLLLCKCAEDDASEMEEHPIWGWHVEFFARGRNHPKRGLTKQSMISLSDQRSPREILLRRRGMADFGDDTERWLSKLRECAAWNPDVFTRAVMRDSDMVWWAQLYAILVAAVSLLEVQERRPSASAEVNRELGGLGGRYRTIVGRLCLRRPAVIQFGAECGLNGGACGAAADALGSG